jgi:DNA-binding HxlR family transcriptional regulator
MANQVYGQFCGFARAVELVGEPWALLVVRDLTVEPKSFEELRNGLPRIPAGTLSDRLEELEHAGVIRRRTPLASPVASLYELTEYGTELEDIVFRLGRWGAKKLGSPRRDEIVTPDSMIMALRTMFRPEATQGLRLSYQLRLGEIALYARIDDKDLELGKGLIDDADLTIVAGPAFKALMAGDMSPREALESGSVQLIGDPVLLSWFAEIFHIPPAPPSSLGLNRKPVAIGVGEPALNGHSNHVGAFS